MAEGKSDDCSDNAHFPLHGRIRISAVEYFIDETAHGLRGLHLESESRHYPAGKCTEKSDTLGTRPQGQVLRGQTESIGLAQPSVQEKTHGYDANIPYHEGH